MRNKHGSQFLRKTNQTIFTATFLFIFLILGIGLAKASTIYVPVDFGTIQEGIDAAVNGDEIIVSDGTYVENINFLGKAITVRSENGAASTTIDGNYNGSVVTFSSGETSSSVLYGFSIINGSGTLDQFSTYFGGGIFCVNSSPMIVDCIISSNSTEAGGGVFFRDSSPTITDCIISNNLAGIRGGGVECLTSSAIITNCTISGNLTGQGGGIMLLEDSSTIENCTIINNSASGHGGGAYSFSNSTSSFINCTISGNSAGGRGGGIACHNYVSPTFTNCTISGNSAGGEGGGIYCSGLAASATIINCTISGNSTSLLGGAIYTTCSGSYCANTSLTVLNSILWGNKANTSNDEIYLGDVVQTYINYSNIQGGWPTGTDNLNADPLFVNERPASEAPTIAGDYHLQAGTPCFDAGTDDTVTYPYLPIDDIDGDTRPQATNYDMGSDEYVCTDSDSDGYYAENGCNTAIDCDDNNPDKYPGNPEVCDYLDNNCDGNIDEGVANTYYRDADGDSYGDLNVTLEDCTVPSGYVIDSTDCDDTYNSINPGATEVCNGIDDNCDGSTDENLTRPTTCGVGECSGNTGQETCDAGSWGGDTCDPLAGATAEVCDNLDNNCDGAVDEGLPLNGYYLDADVDTYGDPNNSILDCGSAPAGYVTDNTDCDDTNPDINPAACDIKRNGIDEDCDGADRNSGPACSGGSDPEICDDGVDNDGDGDVDCDDSDCIGDPVCLGGCVPSAEICDDDIDNDCDGKTDCADKKDCRGFSGC